MWKRATNWLARSKSAYETCEHGRGAAGANQASAEFLAALEHELRLHRDSIRVRIAKQQPEPDFRNARGETGRHTGALDCCAGLRPDHSTDYRLHERSDMESARPPQTLLPGWSDSGVPCSAGHAQLADRMGCGGDALDVGRFDQYHDGTNARLRR